MWVYVGVWECKCILATRHACCTIVALGNRTPIIEEAGVQSITSTKVAHRLATEHTIYLVFIKLWLRCVLQ